MNTNSFWSRNYVIGWIAFWKVLDVISTFLIVGVTGWGAEINLLARLFGHFLGEIGYILGVFLTIPLGVLLAFLFWKNYTILVEVIALVLPVVVFSHLIGLRSIFYAGLVQTIGWAGLLVYMGFATYLQVFKGRERWQSLWIGEESYYFQ